MRSSRWRRFGPSAAPEREDAEDPDAGEGDGGAGAEARRTRMPIRRSRNSRRPAIRSIAPSIPGAGFFATISTAPSKRTSGGGTFSGKRPLLQHRRFSIWDFVDGVSDIRARRLKLIGDPETRYREDPVRMLRAVRFAAKLDFSIDPNTEQPIKRLAYLLDGVPPAAAVRRDLELFLSDSARRRIGCCSSTVSSSICFRSRPPLSRCDPMPTRRKCWSGVWPTPMSG